MSFLTNDLSANIISIFDTHQKERDEILSGTPYSSLSFRYSGDTDFLLNGERFNSKKNNILFLPEMIDYEHITKKPEHLIVIHFKADIPPDSKIEVFSADKSGVLENLFRTAYKIWNSKKIGFKYDATSCVYKIFSILQQQNFGDDFYVSSEKIEFALEYIHEHYTEPELSVSHIANVLGISETYFRRLFNDTLKVTPLKYINDLRLSYSQELLRSGFYSVSEAATMSGFSDPNYFCTVIKKATGLSPSQLIKNTSNI